MSLPTGTVTMLFSDMEGSTRLLSQLGDGYGEILSAQRSLLRAAFGDHEGTELGTEGDSFFVVFPSAVGAVSSCAQAQRTLSTYDWPDGHAPQIRMGLHTGEPTRHEDGYIGMDVHRAARIAATAHGGQVVLSDATCQLVDGRLPGLGLADLGWHRLKDIAEAEHLHQLLMPGLPAAFPPLRSLGNRSNLPAPATPLIGRARQLDELAGLLSGPDPARLVTLTGPGGVGKTRLALALADSLDQQFPDGVYFIPLAPVTETAVLWTTLADAVGATGESRTPPAFFDHIARRRALLVLDNLEQLAGAAEVIAQLMSVAPGLTVLATSRRSLRVPGEQHYPVPPLSVPGRGLTASAETSAESAGHSQAGAVELFVQLARMARPGFTLTERNAADVTAICGQLDGLPLAIELAAARVRLLSPRALRGQLGQSLEFQAGVAGRPVRQRTLRDTMSWSYDLLDAAAQASFRRMGVFAGGCDLASLALVAAGEAAAFDCLSELADASLVEVTDSPDGEPRVFLLQTIQAFARQRLAEADEETSARLAHAACYAELAEAAGSQLQGAQPVLARDRMTAELENIRIALAWCLQPPSAPGRALRERAALGLRLCAAMSGFWWLCGYAAEGNGWQRQAVAAAAAEGGPELATALHGLSILLLQQGEAAEARDGLAACLEIRQREGSRLQVATEMCSLAVAHWTLGDLETSRALLRESAAISRQEGDETREATALTNLGVLETADGNARLAVEMFQQVRVIDTRLGNVWGLAITESNLAMALVRAGRPDEGDELLRGIAAGLAALGDTELTIATIEIFAAIAAGRGDPSRAARLLGTADALREQAGMPRAGPDARMLEECVGPARASVAPQAWDDQLRAGQARTARDALAEAGVVMPEPG